MNNDVMREYRARMAVAQIFREHLERSGERACLLKLLDIEQMPVVVPALASTAQGHIRKTVSRYLEMGEQYVIVPVDMRDHNAVDHAIEVLIVCEENADGFWYQDASGFCDDTPMTHIVQCLAKDALLRIELLGEVQQSEHYAYLAPVAAAL